VKLGIERIYLLLQASFRPYYSSVLEIVLEGNIEQICLQKIAPITSL